MTQATVFVDSCIFLEFNPFPQLPWRKIVGADRVKLVVCLPVLNELDNKKTYDHRLSDRARRSYKDIEEHENKEFQEGVTLTIVGYSLRRESYPETMNPDHRDDQIIRCAQVFLDAHPEAAPVMIVTDDGSMKVRCRVFGIPVVGVPETERLPVPQDDLQKKVRKLEADLAAERNRRPEFAVLVTPTDGNVEEAGSRALLPSSKFQVVDVSQAVQTVKRKTPKIESSNPFNFRRLSLLGQDQIANYNADLDKYYARCQEYYTKLNRWVQARGQFYDFDLYLKNQGRGLATHIQLEMIFPPFVRLLDADTKTSTHDPMPMPPFAPKEPDPTRGLFSTPFLPAPGRSVVEQLAAEPHTPKVYLSNDGSGARLYCTLGKLLHGDDPIMLRNVTFWFPKGEEPKTFGAQYSILAAELPSKAEGQVVFNVNTLK
jgi:hypothetical protein